MALCRKDLPALLEMKLLPWADTTPDPCSPGCLATLTACDALS